MHLANNVQLIGSCTELNATYPEMIGIVNYSVAQPKRSASGMMPNKLRKKIHPCQEREKKRLKNNRTDISTYIQNENSLESKGKIANQTYMMIRKLINKNCQRTTGYKNV